MMDKAYAYLRHARISPRKVKIVCDLIRGKDTKTAEAILMATPKAASELMLKLLKSACANAENNFHMDADTASRFYDAFIPAYFGPDCDPEKITEILLPYAGLKTLIIERDANCPKPEFREALQSIL